MSNNIQNLRNQIRSIDEKIIKLLQDRIRLSHQIGSIKKQKGLKIKDRKQEKKVLTHIETLTREPLYTQDIKQLYAYIIKICKKSQKPGK